MSPIGSEELFHFPTEIDVKALGAASDDFESHVVAIVRRHVPDLGEGAVRRRESRKGAYLSVTVRIRATSRAQLDAIYRDLSADARVKVAL